MSENFERTFKRGDTGPAVRACVVNAQDRSVPDWSAATVVFIMWRIDEDGLFVEIVNAAGAVETPTDSSGTLRYDWAAGDTDLVGRFPAKFRVAEGAEIESYPDEGYMWINIEEGA